MSQRPNDTSDKPTLSLKIGSWFEANATGWAVICVPLVVFLLMAVAWLQVITG